MPASSWRELLRDIISNSVERERIANAMGVHPMTLNRWVSGESNPRPQNLRQLLYALRHEQRGLMIELLEKDAIDLSDPLTSDSLPDQIEYPFVMQILELRATTTDNLLFWTLCQKVFLHAIRQLDAERIGIALRVVQCMPPSSSDGIIHSLRESMGLGTPPWQRDLEQEGIFLGAESLAGYVVASCRPESVQNLATETIRLPTHRAEYEMSATAVPILYANRVAGCLLVSSTQPNYFLSQARLSLIYDYARLISLAFKPEQFYPPACIKLRIMPPFEVQRTHLTTFRDRVLTLMRETIHNQQPLTRSQAEQLVWRQCEEELIQTPVQLDWS